MTSIRTRVASSVLAAAAVFSTVALAAPGSAAPDKPANPSAQAVGCNIGVPPDRDRINGDFRTSARIRMGPSTDCRSLGLGFPGHRADYHCYVRGPQGDTWTYLRDVRTGFRGWVRDDLLTRQPGRSIGGSYELC